MDEFIVESKQMGEYLVEVLHDDNGFIDSPREWDNLGMMYCYHRRYNLGDEKLSENYNTDDFSGWDEFSRQLTRDGHILIMPLGLYDHSGITMYISDSHDRWDGGQVGFICTTKQRIRECYGVKKITKATLDKAREALKNEVKTYDDYLVGNVYGFRITKDGDEVDSCWGFIGDYKYCLDEGVSQAKYYQEADRKARLAQVKTWIINHVPLNNRIAI